MQFNNYLLFW